MISRDHVALGKIGNSAGKLQDAMVGTSREVQLLHGGFNELFSGRLNFAELAHFGWPHFGIAGHSGTFEPLQLAFASGLHTLANGLRGLHLPFIGQFLVVHTGNFDVDIYAVEQRAADALLVACDGGGRTGAFLDRVPKLPAGAPMRVAVVGKLLHLCYTFFLFLEL